jgi:hypothetical protein
MSYVRYFWLLIGVSSAASVVLLRPEFAPPSVTKLRPSRPPPLRLRGLLRSPLR